MATVCLYFALAAYAVMLPMMLYRFIFLDAIPQAAQPTIAVLAAPASLSLVAYLNLVANPSILVVITLYGIALLMTFTVYLAFIKLLALPFSPGYAAFTFPVAIAATAQFRVADQLIEWGVREDVAQQIRILGTFELISARCVVSYVAVRYTMFLVGLRSK